MREVCAVDVICGRVEETMADAVVNAANEHLAAGSGICGAIFRKAGYAPLQAACEIEYLIHQFACGRATCRFLRRCKSCRQGVLALR